MEDMHISCITPNLAEFKGYFVTAHTHVCINDNMAAWTPSLQSMVERLRLQTWFEQQQSSEPSQTDIRIPQPAAVHASTPFNTFIPSSLKSGFEGTASSLRVEPDGLTEEKTTNSTLVQYFCSPKPSAIPDTTLQETLKDTQYHVITDKLNLLEIMSSIPQKIQGKHALCDMKRLIINASQYSPTITNMYAEKDGCIPATIKLNTQKFVIPWRYKNKKTGVVSWKLYHLENEEMDGPESEIIAVNPMQDKKLLALIDYVTTRLVSMEQGASLVELLLKIVRQTMGTYGMKGGPTSQDADAELFAFMKR